MNCSLYRFCLLLPVTILSQQACVPAVLSGSAAVASSNVALDPRTAGTQVEDQVIELKVARVLSADQAIKEQTHINVVSYNRAVLLTGEAPDESLRARAVELTSSIEKVRHIHNEILIAAPSALLSRSSDAVITGEIKSRLLLDQQVRGRAIKVVTENGTVFLMGLVTVPEEQVAIGIAQRIKGVQKVVTLFERIADSAVQ